jgi:hypothetical protein
MEGVGKASFLKRDYFPPETYAIMPFIRQFGYKIANFSGLNPGIEVYKPLFTAVAKTAA